MNGHVGDSGMHRFMTSRFASGYAIRPSASSARGGLPRERDRSLDHQSMIEAMSSEQRCLIIRGGFRERSSLGSVLPMSDDASQHGGVGAVEEFDRGVGPCNPGASMRTRIIMASI